MKIECEIESNVLEIIDYIKNIIFKKLESGTEKLTIENARDIITLMQTTIFYVIN
jgi:hypothetical protein